VSLAFRAPLQPSGWRAESEGKQTNFKRYLKAIISADALMRILRRA
jgi:hypothetical protein